MRLFRAVLEPNGGLQSQVSALADALWGSVRERTSIRFARVPAAAAAGVASACIAAGSPAWAGEEAPPQLELFNGIDATGNSRFGYVGRAWAFGRDIDAPGWRLRALGGYGGYAYEGAPALSGGDVPMRFHGDVALAELLAGRLWRKGEWTFKVYTGVQYVEHMVSPEDPANSVTGAEWGAKGQVDIWRDLGTRGWFSANASYGTAFDDYRLLARLGFRTTRRFTFGLEAGGLGNAEHDAGRGGAFTRLHLDGADITLSGGVSGDRYGERTGGYIALEVYRKR